VREGNPSPGNKAGGLTTLEEKSLGCIHKGGHRTIQAVYDYGKQVDTTGLVIMDTPGNDPSSVAGMVAGGCQVCVFSTGRGTPTGNPIVPVIKITGNKITFQNMEDNIDYDASPVIYGKKTMGEQGDELLAMTMEVVNGKQTKAESLGYTEMAIARVCNYV
jgi:altronate dehydratase large subunit